MLPKTFHEVLVEEFNKQVSVVLDLDDKLRRLVDGPSPDPKEVMRLMEAVSHEKRTLLPLKKVIDAYNRGVLK